MKTESGYNKGYFIEMGLVLGIPVGIPIGLALGNIAYGPLIGSIIGLTVGAILEKRLNKNPIELTKAQKSKKNKVYWILFITGSVIFTGLLLYKFLR